MYMKICCTMITEFLYNVYENVLYDDYRVLAVGRRVAPCCL